MAFWWLTSLHAASGEVSTWTGAGSQSAPGIWAEGLNWSAGIPPTGSDLVFSSVVGTSSTPTLMEGSQVNSVKFAPGAAGFTIGGPHALALSAGGITNLSDQIQRFSVQQITVLRDQTWDASSGALTFTGGSVLLQGKLSLSGTAPITIGNQLSGTGAITVTGSGNVLLQESGAANNFSGGTDLLSGMLRVGTSTALGTGKITLTGGTFSHSSTSALSISNPVFFGGNVSLGDSTQTLPLALSGNASLQGQIRTLNILSPVILSGVLTNGSLIKGGPGPLTLTRTNNYNETTIQEGTLTIETSGALGTTAAPVKVFPGGALQLRGSIYMPSKPLLIGGAGAPGSLGALVNLEGTNTLPGKISITAPTTIAAESGTLALASSSTLNASSDEHQPLILTGNGTGILSGGLAADISSLSKQGAGTWIISGEGIMTGPTTLASGTLKLMASGALKGSSLSLEGGTLVFGSVKNFILGGIQGTQPLALQANPELPGAVGLQVGNNNESTHYAGSLSGMGSIDKAGKGTLILSGSNSHQGGTLISGGALRIRNGHALGNSSQGTQILAAGTLEIEGGITLESGKIEIKAAKPPSSTPSILNVSGTNYYGGHLQLADGGAPILESKAGKLILTGTGKITGKEVALVLAGAGDGELGMSIATIGGSLTKGGLGTWVLGGTNSYTGKTQVSEGRLVVQGALVGSTSIAVAMGASLVVPGSILSSSTLNVEGTLQMPGSVGNIVALPGATLAIGADPGITGTGSAQSLTLKPGAHLLWRIGDATNYDQFAINGGNLSLAGDLQAEFREGFTPEQFATFFEGTMNLNGQLFFLTSGAGVLEGRFSNEIAPGGFTGTYPTISLGGYLFAISYQADAKRAYFDAPIQGGVVGRDVALMLVPEPGIGISLIGGAGLLLAVRLGRVSRSTPLAPREGCN